jgi:hypothetical protein
MKIEGIIFQTASFCFKRLFPPLSTSVCYYRFFGLFLLFVLHGFMLEPFCPLPIACLLSSVFLSVFFYCLFYMILCQSFPLPTVCLLSSLFLSVLFYCLFTWFFTLKLFPLHSEYLLASLSSTVTYLRIQLFAYTTLMLKLFFLLLGRVKRRGSWASDIIAGKGFWIVRNKLSNVIYLLLRHCNS